jgi:tRNA pseudouridine38-40 synthase
MKYFAKIKYVGTDFRGFQFQPNQRTVQGELTAASRAALGADATVTGCSRTDSGVHANEYCVAIESKSATVPADKLAVALKSFLPHDISLFYAEYADDEFHPRYNVKSKEYLYRIVNSEISDPFEYNRAWFVGREISDEKIKMMQYAADTLIGKHDFSSFMAEGSKIVDTVRCIEYITIDKSGDLIEIKVAADGFLYNMVRIIVGTLIDVAFDRIKASDMKTILDEHDRAAAGQTAPPQGLYLNKVVY